MPSASRSTASTGPDRGAVDHSGRNRQSRVGLLGRTIDSERVAAELLRLDPGYAPAYLELGLAQEAARNYAKPVEAYDAYVLLAQNYVGTSDVRDRAEKLRAAGRR